MSSPLPSRRVALLCLALGTGLGAPLELAAESFRAWIRGFPIPEAQQGLRDDFDRDRIPHFLEYATGLSPVVGDKPDILTIEHSGDTALVSFSIPGQIEGVVYEIEVSTDFVNWSSDDITLVNQGGDDTETWSAVHQVLTGDAIFRLRVFNRETNAPPRFTSTPVTTVVAGTPYAYPATAEDDDLDPLTFSLLGGPAGMAVAPATGALTWSPGAADLGNHAVVLQVDDGHDGTAVQAFTLSVTPPQPNRPPVFTSTPAVAAAATTAYTYTVAADDPDGDPVTFRLVGGPDGMTLAGDTLSWLPGTAQSGTATVEVEADDGNGARTTQRFVIAVGGTPGNTPPVFTSEPVTTVLVPPPGNAPSGDVSPASLTLDLPFGSTEARQATITLPADTPVSGAADIVITVDQSGSMQNEHEWLPGMITALEDALLARGIGPNRWVLGGFPRGLPQVFNVGAFYDVQVVDPAGTTVFDGTFDELVRDLTPSFVASLDGNYTVVFTPHDDTVSLDLALGLAVDDPPGTVTNTGLDTVLEGQLAADETLSFPFSARAGTVIVPDSLLPRNTSVARRVFTAGGDLLESLSSTSEFDLFAVPADGDYQFRLTNNTASPQPYRFRLVSAREAVAVGSRVRGQLRDGSTGLASELYFVDAEPGDTLYFRNLGSDDTGGWGLFDPNLEVAFRSGLGLSKQVTIDTPGRHFLVLYGENEAAPVTYDFEIVPSPGADPPVPLAFNTETAGTIAVPGEARRFSFVATAGDVVYYDGLPSDPDMRIKIIDPLSATRLNVPAGVFTFSGDRGPLRITTSGTHHVYLTADGGATGDFAFTLHRLGDAPSLDLGTATTLAYHRSRATQLRAFDAVPGQRFFFEQVSGSDQSDWHIARPDGSTATSEDRLADMTFVADTAGTHTLVVAGRTASDTSPFTVRASGAPLPAPLPLTLGQAVSGTATPATPLTYTFDAVAGDGLVFDGIAGDNDTIASLDAPDGSPVYGFQRTSSDRTEPDRLTLTGTYRLTVSNSRRQAAFSFRVLNTAAATAVPLGTPTTVSLTPGEIQLHTIDAGAGSLVDLVSQSITPSGTGAWRFYGTHGHFGRSTQLTNDITGTAVAADGPHLLVLSANASSSPFDFTFLPTVSKDAPVAGAGLDVLFTGTVAANTTQTVHTFTASAGDTIFLDNRDNAGSALRRWIFAPSGEDISARISDSDAAPLVLPESGTYTIDFENRTGAPVDYDAFLFGAATAPAITRGAPTTVSLGPTEAAALFTFTATAGERLALSHDGSTSGGQVRVFTPDGSERVSDDSDDFFELTFDTTATYYLVVSNDGSPAQLDVDFQLAATTTTTLPLTLNQITTGTVANPGDSFVYTFDADAGTRLAFDGIGAPSTAFQATLTTASGSTPVSRLRLNGDSNSPFTLDTSGTHTLTVDPDNGDTGAFAFKLAHADTPLDLGAPETITFSPGTGDRPNGETILRTVTATAGQVLTLSLSENPSIPFRLDHPDDALAEVGNLSTSPLHLRLERSGTHILRLFGPTVDGRTLTLNASLADDPTIPLTLGDITTATIDPPGLERHFTFAATAGTRVLYRHVTDDVVGQANPSLYAPDGTRLFSLIGIDRSSSVVTLPETGTYRLLINAGLNTAGSVGFRLIDVGQIAPLDPGAPLATAFASTDDTLVFSLPALAGQTITFDRNPSVFAGADTIATATSRLTLSGGGTEDGWAAIDVALDLDFKPGAAVNMILVTDEDRDQQVAGLSFAGMAQRLSETGVVLNAVIDGSFDDGAATTAVGVDAGANAYLPDGAGGFTSAAGGTYTGGFGTTGPDYVDLAWATGGAAWDLKELREGGLAAESFTNAFVSIKADEIIRQLAAVEIVPSDLSAPLVNLSGVLPEATGTPMQFDIQFTGDGTARSFDLLFVRPNSNTVLGSLPVTLHTPYTYTALATDPDGDPLTYSAPTLPAGAGFDPPTRSVSFTPTSPGSYVFSLLADDGRGGRTPQHFTLDVNASTDNAAPAFTSTPPAQTGAGRPFSYPATASDPDGEPVAFFIDRAPSGMTVDRTTGQVAWLPSDADLGSHNVALRALDARGATATQEFTLTVNAQLANRPPAITSNPPAGAATDTTLRYNAAATDADGDPLTFELTLKPTGMTIDPATGVIAWTPSSTQQGTNHVVLRALDPFGGIAVQPFTLDVSGTNVAPQFASSPPATAFVGIRFNYTPQVTDPEADPLGFTLVGQPAGASVDDTDGTVSWLPGPGDVGTVTFTLTAFDPFGSSQQTITLDVTDPGANRAPLFTSTPRTKIALGKTYYYLVEVADPDGQDVALSLTTSPPGMELSPENLVTWTPAGEHFGDNPVVLEADDGLGGVTLHTFTLEVATTDANLPPAITTSPALTATVDQLYTYRPAAADPEGDPFIWQLDGGPDGMQVDPATGILTFTPGTGQVDDHDVALRALDAQGASSLQSWTLSVRASNLPPEWLSAPPSAAAADTPYTYQAAAADPNGDPLTYTLPTAPGGASITPGGLLSWTPSAAQLGAHTLTVAAADGFGGSATQTFTVTVLGTLTSAPPAITSLPTFAAQVGEPYTYQVAATDPEDGALTFAFLDAPAGMAIDPVGGLVTWTPAENQLGPNPVSVLVTDPAGEGAYQAFTVTVLRDNRRPVITNGPTTAAAVGLEFAFDLLAYDPDDDPLTFTVESGPPAMAIDGSGRLRWTPSPADAGTADVVVHATDPLGAFASLSFELPVVDDTDGPSVGIELSANPVDPGTQVTVSVTASDLLGIASLVARVGGTPVALDENQQFRLTPDAFGAIEITATATDPSGNSTTDTATLNVIDTSDVAAPFVLVDSPGPGADISTPVEVVATVRDTNLASYELTLEPIEGGTPRTVFTGTGPAESAVVGTLDPTTFANGAYKLRLRATDTGGLSSTDEFTVSISGDLKLGNFQVVFGDLIVPVNGIPITVNRVYDTLEADRSGDFGHGWRLDIADTRLRTTLSNAQSQQGDEIFPAFRPGERVFVTAPGGKRLGFTFEPEINNPFFPIFDPAFTPDPGVTAQLTVDRVDLRFDDVHGEFVTYIERFPYNPAAPAFGEQYTLTTADGLAYRVNAFTGDLETLTDPNDNRLTFTETGITSSSGTGITFERDAAGRITAIIDPAGERIEYIYDANGDLTTVTDRDDNVTTFTYEPTRPHFLKDITDPLGRTGQRNTYDENGRLTTTLDVNGEPTTYTYDPENAVQTITDTIGRTTVLEFDPSGNLVKSTDPAGGTTERTYDANFVVTSIKDPLGRTTSFTNDDRGNVTAMTSPLGHTSTFTYNAFSSPLTITDPLGNTTTNTYDDNGNRTSTTDALGNTTTFEVDAQGNTTQVTDPLGNTTEYTYDNDGKRTGIIRRDPAGDLVSATAYTIDANGNRTSTVTEVTTPAGARTLTSTAEYDNEGNLTRTVDAEGNETTFELDATGNIAATVDAGDRRTEFTHNAYDKLTGITLPDGTTNAYGFDDEQRMTSNTDPLGRTTKLEYDAIDRLAAAVYPDATPEDDDDNPRITYEHDATGQKTARIDERGNRTEYAYDEDGNRTSIRDAHGNATTFAHDAGRRLTSQTDPLGNTTTFLYDSLDRLLQTTYPDGTTTSQTYDARGNLASQTDQAGRTTSYEYDSRDNLTAVTDPAGGRTEYEYDENNNRTLQRDANNHVTRFEYDGLGNLTATVRPSGARQTHTYDAVGNLATTTRFDGTTVTFTYDDTDRLVRTTYPDGSATTTTFDDPSRTRTESLLAPGGAPVVSSDYALDPRLRTSNKTATDGTDIAYTYDAAGNVTAHTTPNGTTTYTYNATDQIESVTDHLGNTTSYLYDPAGNLVRTDYPNGVRETRTYDPLHRLVAIEHAKDGATVARFDYTLDPSGLKTSLLDHTGNLTTYTYDAAKRLTSENTDIPGVGTHTTTYTYDAVGNRLTKDDSLLGLTTYTYNDDDQLTSAGSTTYTYDDRGNLVSETTDAANHTTYTYDQRDRLTSVATTTAGTTSTTTYTHDAKGNRISQTKDGTTTRFRVDDARENAQTLEDTDTAGAALARYTLGFDRISQARGNAVRYYHADAQGTTRVLTDHNGAVSDTYTYDAFGNILDTTGTTDNRFLYTGESQDPATGLVHLRARTYDPATGRFLSTDPFEGIIEQPVSLHRYLYANANPANVTDPSGRFSVVESSIISSFLVSFQKQFAQAAGFAIVKIAIIADTTLKVGITSEEMGLLLIIADVDGGIDKYNVGLELKRLAFEQIRVTLDELGDDLNSLVTDFLDSIVNQSKIIEKSRQLAAFVDEAVAFANSVGEFIGDPTPERAKALIDQGRSAIDAYKTARGDDDEE